MGCDTCIFLNNVRSLPQGDGPGDQKGALLEPCSMNYNCNPYYKDGHNSSVIVSESYCATCNELDKDCMCEGAQRQIRLRKKQVPRNHRHSP